jgi:hypothetical protein
MGTEGLVIYLDTNLCNDYPKRGGFLSAFNVCFLLTFSIFSMKLSPILAFAHSRLTKIVLVFRWVESGNRNSLHSCQIVIT